MAENTFKILETGPVYAFRDWPNSTVPRVAAGVYTVWEATRFLYVGMAGEDLTADTINRLSATNEKSGFRTEWKNSYEFSDYRHRKPAEGQARNLVESR